MLIPYLFFRFYSYPFVFIIFYNIKSLWYDDIQCLGTLFTNNIARNQYTNEN